MTKSKISKPKGVKFLGFGSYLDSKGKYQVISRKESKKKLKSINQKKLEHKPGL